MSLSRAFTVIRSIKSTDSNSSSIPPKKLLRKSSIVTGGGSIRDKISAPMELISTTNMISYNAPDITQHSRSFSSDSSDSENSRTDLVSPITSVDSSSIESSSPPSCPKPNHLSCYFGSQTSREKAPSIPKRAPSHTKTNNLVDNFLGRKNSKVNMSNIAQKKMSLGSAPGQFKSMARSSLIMFSPEIETIAQEEECSDSDLAAQYPEEVDLTCTSNYQSIHVEYDPEEREILSRGFYKFRADDYVKDLEAVHQVIYCTPEYGFRHHPKVI